MVDRVDLSLAEPGGGEASVNMVDRVDTVDKVDNVDRVDRVDKVH